MVWDCADLSFAAALFTNGPARLICSITREARPTLAPCSTWDANLLTVMLDSSFLNLPTDREAYTDRFRLHPCSLRVNSRRNSHECQVTCTRVQLIGSSWVSSLKRKSARGLEEHVIHEK